jgi:hypothetical protein
MKFDESGLDGQKYKISGRGTIVSDVSDDKKFTYSGAFRDSIMEGEGKLTYISARGEIIYEGEFKNNSLDGEGAIVYEDGHS